MAAANDNGTGKVVMIGVSLAAPGGMTAVVQLYREMGLFSAWDVRYIASYERPGKFTQLRVMALAMLSLLRLLLRGQAGLVHVHAASRGSFWRKSVFCAMARLFNVPYVFHLHSGEFPVFYRDECGLRAQRWVRRTLEGAHTVVALTGVWRAALATIAPAARIAVLGNPVQVASALPQPHGRAGGTVATAAAASAVNAAAATGPQLLFLGRLRDKKGVPDIVRAMPAILARYPDAVFTLAGDGELDATRQQARALDVAHALRTPGWVDGAAKDALMAQADLLLLPSYFEGLPVCILEAMAAGVPVVASNVGGIPELLDHGHCGVLHAPGDVAALAAAVLRVLDDAELRAGLRRAAHARAVQMYSTQAVMAEVSALYGQILTAEGRALPGAA